MLNALQAVGLAILAGLGVGRLFRFLRVPAVAGYVIIGVILGQSVTGLFPGDLLDRLGVVSDLALGVIAFTIGGELKWANLKRIARSVIPIVLLESTGAMLVVSASVWLLFHDWPTALVLGAISAATAPAATVMVIQEVKAAGVLTSTLLAVVGIDDAIALTLYGVAAALAKALLAQDTLFSMSDVMAAAGHEIGGALVLGVLVGAVVAPWVKRLTTREAVFTLTVGALVAIVGLSQRFGTSSLLANMVFGVVLVNAAPISCRKAFDQMAVASAPLFIAFFVLAGAHLRLDLLPSLGLLGAVYLLARIVGKVGGASLGGLIARAPRAVRRNIGLGLLSQVGIAIGLSLVVAKEFAPYGEAGRALAVTVINILLATTVITEVVGPMLTRYALIRSGEAGKRTQELE